MLLISANTAPTPIPINFSGIEMSQTSGHSTSANKANGQHNTNRISQQSSDSMTFACSSPWRNAAYRFQRHDSRWPGASEHAISSERFELPEHGAVDASRHQYGEHECGQASCAICVHVLLQFGAS